MDVLHLGEIDLDSMSADEDRSFWHGLETPATSLPSSIMNALADGFIVTGSIATADHTFEQSWGSPQSTSRVLASHAQPYGPLHRDTLHRSAILLYRPLCCTQRRKWSTLFVERQAAHTCLTSVMGEDQEVDACVLLARQCMKFEPINFLQLSQRYLIFDLLAHTIRILFPSTDSVPYPDSAPTFYTDLAARVPSIECCLRTLYERLCTNVVLLRGYDAGDFVVWEEPERGQASNPLLHAAVRTSTEEDFSPSASLLIRRLFPL